MCILDVMRVMLGEFHKNRRNSSSGNSYSRLCEFFLYGFHVFRETINATVPRFCMCLLDVMRVILGMFHKSRRSISSGNTYSNLCEFFIWFSRFYGNYNCYNDEFWTVTSLSPHYITFQILSSESHFCGK